MSHCFLSPAPECSRDHNEWRRFLIYLQGRDMVKCYCFLFSFGCTDLITFIYFSSILFVFLVHKSKQLCCCTLCITFFCLATIHLFSITISFFSFFDWQYFEAEGFFSSKQSFFFLLVTNRSRYPYALSFLLCSMENIYCLSYEIVYCKGCYCDI